MDCKYVRCSVQSDTGVDSLISTVIDSCLDLENQVAGSITSSKSGSDAIFSLGGQDGLTSGDIKNINPMKLQKTKKKRGCCNDQ